MSQRNDAFRTSNGRVDGNEFAGRSTTRVGANASPGPTLTQAAGGPARRASTSPPMSSADPAWNVEEDDLLSNDDRMFTSSAGPAVVAAASGIGAGLEDAPTMGEKMKAQLESRHRVPLAMTKGDGPATTPDGIVYGNKR